MDDNGSNGSSEQDKVEITLKGSAFAVGNILTGNVLTGNVLRAIEDKVAAEKDFAHAASARADMQSKLWDAQDAERNARARETTARGENDRLTRLVRDRNEEIAEQGRQLASLRAELDGLRNKTAIDLTDDQTSALAAAREKLFQELLANVRFPESKPKPRTLGEMMSFFVFPIFQAGRAPAGWSPGQPMGTSSGVTNKIAMIKQTRELTGAGLKEAKDFIEGLGTGMLK